MQPTFSQIIKDGSRLTFLKSEVLVVLLFICVLLGLSVPICGSQAAETEALAQPKTNASPLITTNNPQADEWTASTNALSANAAQKLYENGVALFKDLKDEKALKEGFALFKQAADAGHAEAMNAVGTAEIFGFGTKQLPANEGVELIRKAADAGSVKALYNLSSLVQFKIAIKADPKLALSYLEKAAMKGDVESEYQLAKALLDPQIHYDLDMALAWFKRAAKGGNTNAAAWVGALNLSRHAPNPDSKTGFLLLNQLVNVGNGPAMYFLGEHYAGDSPKDTNDLNPARALDYLIQANETDMGPLPIRTAMRLTHEIATNGFEKRRTEQAIAFLESKATNDCLAAYLLASIYITKGSKYQDYTKGRSVLELGAKRECYHCLVSLGDVYAMGIGVATNLLKAGDYYASALDKDSYGEVAYKASAIFFNHAVDKGQPAPKTAYQLALRSATYGNAEACDLLATMLVHGMSGESQTEEKSYAWALIAAEYDLPHSQTPPSKLEEKLTDEQKEEGVKISQFFKILIRKHALQEGEKSFRF